jgi:hypothetical protein
MKPFDRKLSVKLKIRNLSLFAALILSAAALAAETASEDSLGTALKAKDIDGVKTALSALGPGTPELQAAEQRVLGAARDATLGGDYDYALALANAILLTDLDNTEAQDLYTSIEESKRSKAELEAKQQAAAQAEQKKKDDDAKAQAAAEAAERERQQKEAFIASVRVIGLKNFSLALEASPAGLTLYGSPFADAYWGSSGARWLYGFSGGAEARFTHPYVSAALRARYEYSPMALGTADERQDFRATASVGTGLLGIPLFITGGYQNYSYFKADGTTADTVLFTALSGPTLGFGVEHLAMGPNLDLSLGAEWLTAGIEDAAVSFSFQAELSARYKLKPLFGFLRPYLGVDLAYAGVVAASQIESAGSASLTLGALLNEYR